MDILRRNRGPVSKARRIISIAAIALVLSAMYAMSVFAANIDKDFFFGKIYSFVPPIVAIVLALITKEVYSSLFIGILVGGLFYSGFSFEGTMNHVFVEGFVGALSDSWNVGILIFLVILGAMVALMNKAGGSAAFGRWAAKKIKTRAGAQAATIILGMLIFVDDYFNCLTVGSVMRPVSDSAGVSRAKLAYLIDATAAPVCIIAPISSWAAAVSGYVGEGQGITAFIRSIPFNFYAILTIVMMFFLLIFKLEYGPMKKHEDAAKAGDIFNGKNPYANEKEEEVNPKGRVADLIIPVILLIAFCVTGLVYTGGIFEGANIVEAFSNSDASVGLMLGGAIALVITVIYYLIRRVLSFKECMDSLPEGFKAMVPAILILTFAWTLKIMTDSLGSTEFVESIMAGAGGWAALLPALTFVLACVIAFATGTSWGTFGILIPITLAVFPLDHPLGPVCMSAAMAGAVFGDHCSPISDTTIMSSAGAQCDHISHVNTQMPYALTVAVVSLVTYIIAGFIPKSYIVLPIGIVLMILLLFVIKKIQQAREKKA
ncbi:MAG: Na+/H+ antiporter NhaC family protein [Lachnospiraceae bacterium]|jgi:tetracycline resistance efflux pump